MTYLSQNKTNTPTDYSVSLHQCLGSSRLSFLFYFPSCTLSNVPPNKTTLNYSKLNKCIELHTGKKKNPFCAFTLHYITLDLYPWVLSHFDDLHLISAVMWSPVFLLSLPLRLFLSASCRCFSSFFFFALTFSIYFFSISSLFFFLFLFLFMHLADAFIQSDLQWRYNKL